MASAEKKMSLRWLTDFVFRLGGLRVRNILLPLGGRRNNGYNQRLLAHLRRLQ
jgi:hypothetical protein